VNRGVHTSFCNGLQLINCDLLTELLLWQAKHVGNLGGALTKNLLLKVCIVVGTNGRSIPWSPIYLYSCIDV
jgi:hypothetical protein